MTLALVATINKIGNVENVKMNTKPKDNIKLAKLNER